jgi:hypothetical protein
MSTSISRTGQPGTIIISYITLRQSIGWLGIALAPVLVFGSMILDHTRQIDISISAYYYSHMRNVLVGIICAISLFLISYHGYSVTDSVVSKLSGLFALCVAFVPTSPLPEKNDPASIVHYLTAAAFFVLLSYMSIFLFTKSTAEEMTRQKIKRNAVYRFCGIAMLASVSCIALDNIPFIKSHIPFFRDTIVFETIALTFFGISWLTKGEFILKDKPAAGF